MPLLQSCGMLCWVIKLLMRKIYFIVLLLACKFAFSQSTNQIINIPDSLTNEKEIRIYKFVAITNYSELFRIYQTKDNSTTVLIQEKTVVADQSYFNDKKNKTSFDDIK